MKDFLCMNQSLNREESLLNRLISVLLLNLHRKNRPDLQRQRHEDKVWEFCHLCEVQYCDDQTACHIN